MDSLPTPDTPEPPTAGAVCATCGFQEDAQRHEPHPLGHHPFVPSQPEEAVPGALEEAVSEYNEMVPHWRGCGYNFDTQQACSCDRGRIALALIAGGLAAVRAEPPRGERGGALEAVIAKLDALAKESTAKYYERNANHSYLSGRDHALREARALLAAARAPGPVGGEADHD